MESGDTDGGSEASYESVASEGAFEPASERGRDVLPRIVSASHCVQVFSRLCYSPDGAYCYPDPAFEELRAKDKSGNSRPRRHNPLDGLPARLLRFEGAIEAWLEEVPLGRVPLRMPAQYMSLNDAAERKSSSSGAGRGEDLSVLRAGNRRATIWFFTMEFLQQLWPCFLAPDGSGIHIWERALLERSCTIQSTHVEVGRVHVPHGKGKKRMEWLKVLFAALQTSRWTPNGEARTLLAKRRASHASMSIGDAVQVDGQLFVAGLDGFRLMQQSELLLGENLLPTGWTQQGSEEDEEESEEPEQATASGGKGHRKKGGGEEDENGLKDSAGRRSKGGKNAKGKGKGKGKGGKENGKGHGQDHASRREVEPGPGGKRADRRKLRAQLQAERERVQGS